MKLNCKRATQYSRGLVINLSEGEALSLSAGVVIFETPFSDFVYSPMQDTLRVISNGHFTRYEKGLEELQDRVDFLGVEVTLDNHTAVLNKGTWATVG